MEQVRMSDHNRLLQATFFFSATDLDANRQGKLSPRQQARQRAAGTNMRLAAGVFILVMIGSLGVILFMNQPAGVTGDLDGNGTPILVMAAAVGIAILVGVLISFRHMTSAREKQISTAEGTARWGKIELEKANFELRIGTKKLRLLTEEQLVSFVEGEEYRVYYLNGPVPAILSAEVIGRNAEFQELYAELAETTFDNDQVVQMQLKARPILYVLPVLVLGIPLIGFAIAGFPPPLHWLVMAQLLVISIGFVYWAVRRAGVADNG